MSNDSDLKAAYAAGVFDVTGDAKVTQGDNILKADIGALPSQIPYLGTLYPKRFYKCRTYVSGVAAQKLLEYVRPHVVCSVEMIDKALGIWCKRKSKKAEYLRFVKDSAKPLPSKSC
jgi:hypothetical protein